MGGLNSGKSWGRGRRTNKGWKMLTTRLPALNIPRLMKLHKEGGSGKYTWGEVNLTIDGCQVSTEAEGLLTKGFTVVEIPCHYGGHRYSAHCPRCDKRVKNLYLFRNVFGCRLCLKLAYSSQNQTKHIRLLWRQIDIGERINKDAWNKPKWMRWKTFKRLRSEYLDLEEKIEIANCYSLRNNRQVDEVFNKYGCAFAAIEAYLNAAGIFS